MPPRHARWRWRWPNPAPTHPVSAPAPQLDAAPLQLILSKLDPASLRAAAACCRHFRELSLDVAPGLKLTLFPHQVDVLQSC